MTRQEKTCCLVHKAFFLFVRPFLNFFVELSRRRRRAAWYSKRIYCAFFSRVKIRRRRRAAARRARRAARRARMFSPNEQFYRIISSSLFAVPPEELLEEPPLLADVLSGCLPCDLVIEKAPHCREARAASYVKSRRNVAAARAARAAAGVFFC